MASATITVKIHSIGVEELLRIMFITVGNAASLLILNASYVREEDEFSKYATFGSLEFAKTVKETSGFFEISAEALVSPRDGSHESVKQCSRSNIHEEDRYRPIP
ncbi:hypothetical protein WN943_025603 [Citrus x changshan-huyou]